MKIIILLFLLQLSAVLDINAKIKSDSLLSLCKKSGNIFAVLESIKVDSIDAKDCESNEQLKPYLLQLLDVNVKCDYRSKCSVKKNAESKYQSWLKEQPSQKVESIQKNEKLSKYYRDSISKSYYNIKFNNLKEDATLPHGAGLFYTIKWEEAYVILKKIWDENDAKSSIKFTSDYYEHSVYGYLLAYQDPEIWNYKIHKIVPEKEIKSKSVMVDGKLSYEMYENRGLSHLLRTDTSLCSYDVETFLYLLEYKDSYAAIPLYYTFEPELKVVPFNLGVLYAAYYSHLGTCLRKSWNPIIRNIFSTLFAGIDDLIYFENYKIPMNKLSLEELEKISQKVIDNKEAFREALQPLIDKCEKRDAIWKSKMPYDKYKQNTNISD